MYYQYICQKQKLHDEYIGDYTTYGIALKNDISVCINDVGCDKNFVFKIVMALNLRQVQPSRLRTVIETML